MSVQALIRASLPPANGADHLAGEGADEMTHDDFQHMLDVWQSVAQRQHEDLQAALIAFREMHTQTASECAVLQREVSERAETKIILGQWWRSVAMLVIGAMTGILTTAVPAFLGYQTIVTRLESNQKQQDINVSEIRSLRDMDEKIRSIIEQVRKP